MVFPRSVESLTLHVKEGWNAGVESNSKSFVKNYESIVFCGIGLDAVAGDILSSFLLQGTHPFIVIRDTKMPTWISSNTLVIAASFSGDDEDTIGMVRDAQRMGASLLIVTTGGKLRKFAHEKEIPVILLPQSIPALQRVPSIVLALVAFFAKRGVLKKMVDEVELLLPAIPHMKWEEKAKEFATRLRAVPPALLSSSMYAGVASYWKYFFARMSHVTIASESLPDCLSGPIASWQHQQEKPAVFLIRDEFEAPEMRKRMTATRTFLQESHVPVTEIVLKGQSHLTKTISALHLGELIAYYLAAEKGLDPLDASFDKTVAQHVKKAY